MTTPYDPSQPLIGLHNPHARRHPIQGIFCARPHRFCLGGAARLAGALGVYAAFLSGNGDHYIAHTLACDLDSPWMQHLRSISSASSPFKLAARRGFWQRLGAAIPVACRLGAGRSAASVA